MKEAPARVRDMGPDDVGFVAFSWRANYQRNAVTPDANKWCDMSGMSREELCARSAGLERKLKGISSARCDAGIYNREQSRLIANVLQRDTARAIVAEYDDEDPCLLGFLVYEKGDRPIIHYTYVKDTWRRARVCEKLLAVMREDVGGGPYWCSHWTRYISHLSKHLGETIEFNPYRSFYNGMEESKAGPIRKTA